MDQKERLTILKDNYLYFGGISILYGIIFIFCMYRNQFGLGFSIYTVSTVIILCLFVKKINLNINKEMKKYFFLSIMCGISTFLTSNELIQFLNWCCMIVTVLLSMISGFFPENNWECGTYFLNGCRLFFSSIGSIIIPVKETVSFIINNKKRDNKIFFLIFAGFGSSFVILCIIFPLLLSSDLVFKQLIAGFFSKLNIFNITDNIWTFITLFITFMAGFTLIYGLFYASCRAEYPAHPERKIPYLNPLSGIVFTAVIAAVYLFYSGIQIIYLFLRAELPAGITYSEYAHAGFWQLVAVAFINVCIVLVSTGLFQENRWLKGMLSLISFSTYIMILSAAKRMILYVTAYKLTFTRVLVFWFLGILSLLMGGVVIKIYKKNFKLASYIISVTICGYLLFSFSRPDYWVAKYNVEHSEMISIWDLGDMMYSLSLDAAPVIAEISPDQIYDNGESYYYYNYFYSCDEGEKNEEDIKKKAERYIEDYFENILSENQNIGLRNANYSKIRAKKLAEEKLK